MRVPSRSLSLACAGAAALAAAVGACSGDDAQEPAENTALAPQSGSRLQARYLIDGEGARMFAGWFDATRGEYCRVARGDGGRYYCFPFGNTAVYADATCKRVVGVHGDCALKYTAARRGDVRCDNDTTALWEEEGAVALPSVFAWGNEACRGPDLAAFGSSLVATSRRVPESDLVGGDTRPPRTDLRLGSRVVRFDDGAVAPAVMVDSKWDRRCSPTLTSDGIRCLPDAAVFVGTDGPFFDDSACTTLVGHADAPACLAPKVALRAEVTDGCTRVTGAFNLGFRRNPRDVFSTGSCTGGRALTGMFFQLGSSLELAAFPALTVEERGRGRMRVRTFAAGDGVPAPHLGVRLFDTALGISCRIVAASDGALRCLPVDGPALVDSDPATARFADAACTMPLARMGRPADCMAPPTSTAMMAVRVSARSCPAANGEAPGALGELEPGRWEVHRLGDLYTGAVFQLGSAGCTEAPAGEPLYALGDVIDPASFARFHAE
jgi:hypothetical protein